MIVYSEYAKVMYLTGKHFSAVLTACFLWSLILANEVKTPCRLKRHGTLFDCSKIGLTEIPPSIPKTVTFADFSYNNISRISKRTFFSQLLSIRVSHCRVSVIDKDAFEYAVKLKVLDISTNHLKNDSFEDGCFNTLTRLKRLYIQNNKFHIDRFYPLKEITSLIKLQYLFIDVFDGFKFGNEVQQFTELKSLALQGTNSLSIQNDSFVAFHGLNIQNFTFVSRRFIPKLDVNFLHPFQHIKVLVMRLHVSEFNVVLKSLYPLQNKTMSLIDLSKTQYEMGKMTFVNISDIQYLRNIYVKVVLLDENVIGEIPWFSLSHSNFGNYIRNLDISYNRLLNEQFILALPFFKNIQTLRACCMSPCVRNRHNKNSDNPKTLTIFFPDSFQTLDLSYNDIKFQNLRRLKFKAKSLRSLNLAGTCSTLCDKTVEGLPNLQILNMSDWQCDNLHSKFLSKMTELQSLDASNSGLDEGFKHDENGTFLGGLNKLRNLILSKNKLRTLHKNLLKDASPTLEYLVLRHNLFYSFPIHGWHYPNLKLIDIRNNMLITLAKNERAIIDKFAPKSTILISGNPLSCSCATLDFLHWLKDNRDRVPDIKEAKCSYHGSMSNLAEIIENMNDSLDDNCSSKFLIIISVIMCVLVVVIIVVVLVYCKRDKLEYTLLKISRFWKSRYTPIPMTNTINYDMFVCFSAEDEVWMQDNIAKVLARDNQCKLYLYERDFPEGIAITDCILQAVEQSRYVCFVLSHSFIDSEWGNFKMEIVRRYLEKKTNFNVIAIMKEQIQRKAIPKTLRAILSKSVCMESPENSEDTASTDMFHTQLRAAVIPKQELHELADSFSEI